MAQNKSELRLIVEDFLRKFPTLPTRRIAAFIVEKYPQFESEKTRGMIRSARGQNGTHNRLTSDPTFYNQNYELPPESKYDSSNFIIKESGILVMADLQIPFHDNIAIQATVDWAKDYSKKRQRVEAILLNGDVLDMYQLSTFSRDPREARISEEIESCKDFLALLRDQFDVPIYWKFGNHEERFERYLYQHAPDLGDVKEFTLDAVLKLKDYNCTVIKDKRIVKIGHLNVIHGHEFRGGIIQTVNPARTLFLKAKAPTLGADRHMTSEHSGRAIDGKLITCWTIGCLSDLKPKYQPINEWNHGFGFVKNEGATFRVLNLRIEKGVVY